MPLQAGPDELPPLPKSAALLHSAVAGRTDHLQTKVPAGSYVVPADVVSGVGEGNTLAGAKIIKAVFDGEGAMPLRAKGGSVYIKPQHLGLLHAGMPAVKRAKGGAAEEEHVPILGAGGEMVIYPDALIRKFGNLKRGHAEMDKWVVAERKKIAQEMLKLPGPVKS